MIYEAEIKAQRDERARMRGAYDKGRAEGLAEGENRGHSAGITEGKLEGKLEGMFEGKNEKALEIARNLVSIGMPVEKIVAVTSLSFEEVEELRAH